jgi:hypothetical protein
VLREPDALQPDDQREHQAATCDRGEEGRERAEREGADLERWSRNIGSAARRSTTQNASSESTPSDSRAITRGLVQPVAWAP